MSQINILLYKVAKSIAKQLPENKMNKTIILYKTQM